MAPLGIEDIRKIAIIAMFSDDDLMNLLVLKGGSALDIVYGVSHRASFDLDFSMEREFSPAEMNMLPARIRRVLTGTFREHGYEAFDITFVERPATVSPDVKDFWGGYRIEFKVVRREDYSTLAASIDALRRHAIPVNPRSGKKFQIDISKFEHCLNKAEHTLDGYRIYAYTPCMFVYEKLRSICQQMPEYLSAVNSASGTARARDFFDICVAVEHFKIDIAAESNVPLLRAIFAAKRVPLHLIGEIHKQREYHRPDFAAVQAAVKPGFQLRDFDFYFDYVVRECARLEPLWKV